MIYAVFIFAFLIVFVCSFLFAWLNIDRRYVCFTEKIKPPYAVVTLQNCEDCIEGIIRSLAGQIESQTGYINKLIIVDLDSQDDTASIAKKLCEEYPFITYTTKYEYLEEVSKL